MKSCELLSFFCIFEIQHNFLYWRIKPRNVVNCFHFSVSLRYNTTIIESSEKYSTLWIAFIFLYLWDTTQLWNQLSKQTRSCELLSFFCIFEIQHNVSWRVTSDALVVNCFHFSVSLRYNTTLSQCSKCFRTLWIAFIFLYLWDTTQLYLYGISTNYCCELLSFFCIFEIQHNFFIVDSAGFAVVNCFHFSVSLRYNTTESVNSFLTDPLWIAFIFLYLWDTTQHFSCFIIESLCCELLSFFCIFEIQHNYFVEASGTISVVNCFHFSVSLRYNTTGTVTKCNPNPLWIAFIFLYLWDTTQPWPKRKLKI